MTTHNAGIIGTGGIAGMGILGMHDEDQIGKERVRASHAGGYAATEGVELVAVADVDDEKLEMFGDAWDLSEDRLYNGHHAMLENEDLDVVSVCTPTYLHHQHVLDAARSPASPSVIWCEKPIASSIQDAEEMIKVCRETKTDLVINHSFRFTDKLQLLQSHLSNGLIGDVKSVNAQFRRELLRNSTHLLDTLLFLLDARASTVSGYINGENDAVTSLGGSTEVDDAGGGGIVVLDDGTFVTIDCTVAREISSMAIQLIGTEGKLYLNNDDGEWRFWRLEDGEHVESSIPGIDDAWSWDTDYRRAFANAAEHVQDLLEGNANNQSPGSVAAYSLEIIIGFYISHYTESQVSIPVGRPLRETNITSW